MTAKWPEINNTTLLKLFFVCLFQSVFVHQKADMKYVFVFILVTSVIFEAFTEEAFEQKEVDQDSSKNSASGLNKGR